MVKEKGHQTLKIAREVKQLDAMIVAFGAHNPVEWLSIVKVIAPFIARIAIRAVLRKMGKTTSDQNIEGAVGLVRTVLERIGKGDSKKLSGKK